MYYISIDAQENELSDGAKIIKKLENTLKKQKIRKLSFQPNNPKLIFLSAQKVCKLKPLISRLASTIEQLDKSNSRVLALKGENSALLDKNSDLIDGNSALLDENSKLKDENSELNDEISDLLDKNSKLKDEVLALEDENWALKDENSALKDENLALKDENSTLKGEQKEVTEKDTLMKMLESDLKEKKLVISIVKLFIVFISGRRKRPVGCFEKANRRRHRIDCQIESVLGQER
jgi:predicted nuclease with TOPRIM domain